MGVLADVLPILKKKELSFIESYEEKDGVFTFVFENEKDFHWRAGQHGLFSIAHEKIPKPTRPFSVSSAPFENTINITTKISDTPSPFKEALVNLQPGMKLHMRGPVGPMYIDDEKPSLLIAGGIGITPFRAMLKEAEKQGRSQVHLLYMDSKKSYIYKEELDAIADSTFININYISAREEFYDAIDSFIKDHQGGMYYIGGSKSMVESVQKHLKSRDVSKGSIKKDIFYGL